MLAMSLCFATVLRIALGRENNKLDREDDANLEDPVRNSRFRYLL
jgi:hypothetical protein